MRALTCLCALLFASGAASAGPVYKWKDANGVTQYSESPPAGKKYETREVAEPRRATASEPAATATPESTACTNARDNLKLLNSSTRVTRANADGTQGAELDASQREAQKTLAEAAIKAYCAG